ncbi:MAG: hypothetical protein ACKVPX_00400 [Myxococcaceae bacterium]
MSLKPLDAGVLVQLQVLETRLKQRASLALEDALLRVLESGDWVSNEALFPRELFAGVELSHVGLWILATCPDLAWDVRDRFVALPPRGEAIALLAAASVAQGLVARFPTRREAEHLSDLADAAEALRHGVGFHALRKKATVAQALVFLTQLGVLLAHKDWPPEDARVLDALFRWTTPARGSVKKEIQSLLLGKTPVNRLFPTLAQEIAQFCPPGANEGKVPDFSKPLPVVLAGFANALQRIAKTSPAARRGAERMLSLSDQLKRRPVKAAELLAEADSPWVWQLYFLVALRRAVEASRLASHRSR